MNPKYPSEEQGGFDPIPTHPEPLSPGRTTVNPEDEPGIDELPNNEGAIPLKQDEETDEALLDGELNPR